MWSRRFLIQGLASAAFVATITLGVMWLILAASDGREGLLAGMVLAGIVGIIAYPLSWWRMVHRTRDYSRQRTILLVIVTYCWSCCLFAIAMLVFGVVKLLMGPLLGAAHDPELGLGNIFLLTFLLVFVGGLLMLIPFVIVATPMAFAHRAMMLTSFGEPDPAA